MPNLKAKFDGHDRKILTSTVLSQTKRVIAWKKKIAQWKKSVSLNVFYTMLK